MISNSIIIIMMRKTYIQFMGPLNNGDVSDVDLTNDKLTSPKFKSTSLTSRCASNRVVIQKLYISIAITQYTHNIILHLVGSSNAADAWSL